LGASGLVGRYLRAAIQLRGDDVVEAGLRDPQAAARQTSACDVVVNLAGEPIAQRWTDEAKRRIVESRVEAPRRYLESLAAEPHRPNAYVSASAIGYYGTSDDATFTESSAAGSDFLATVCIAWEREANRAAELGMRVAIVRTGIALATDGGALAKMLPPFRLGLGGKIGSGKQWMSWVHIADLIGVYLLAIDGAEGALNATAPLPVTNADFTSSLGRALSRPTFLPTPILALRAMLGEGADLLLLGQRVVPERTQSTGFSFAYPVLQDAFDALFSRDPERA
jgi:uncharacterized protein (TIGR01777 family)